MTDEEKEASFFRHSRASRGKQSSFFTPDAVARHRAVAASRRFLVGEVADFATSLLGRGFSDSDVAWLLKVSKDSVRSHRRRSAPL